MALPKRGDARAIPSFFLVFSFPFWHLFALHFPGKSQFLHALLKSGVGKVRQAPQFHRLLGCSPRLSPRRVVACGGKASQGSRRSAERWRGEAKLHCAGGRALTFMPRARHLWAVRLESGKLFHYTPMDPMGAKPTLKREKSTFGMLVPEGKGMHSRGPLAFAHVSRWHTLRLTFASAGGFPVFTYVRVFLGASYIFSRLSY